MLVDCCFRLTKLGSVIHSKFDTDIHEIKGYPGLIVKENIKYPRSVESIQYARPRDNFKLVEACLLRGDFWLAIDNSNVEIWCYDWEGSMYCLVYPEAAPNSITDQMVRNFEFDDLYEVGIEFPEYSQFRYHSQLAWRIVYHDGLLFTSKGKIPVEQDVVNRLAAIRPSKDIHEKLREELSIVGYVFLTDGILLIHTDNGVLKIKEVH